MAILVTVNKIKTRENLVTYSFSNEYGSKGYFSVNSLTGELQLTSPMPSDSSKRYFTRAARKVLIDWKEKGILPEHTVWAS